MLYEVITEHIPGAEFHAFQGLGHLPIFAGRREFCDVLRRFAQRVKASAEGVTLRTSDPGCSDVNVRVTSIV